MEHRFRKPRGPWRFAAAMALTLACVVGVAGTAGAQAVKGTLLGNVRDASGLSIPGATVKITEVATNISYDAITNATGYYIFANLKDGTYRVEAELTGFKKTVREGVVIQVNVTVRVDFKMEVGNLTETVNVTAEAPLLQTDRADTGRTITSIQIQEVPLGNNRNFQNLLVTVPGATRPYRPHSEFFNAQDSLSTNVNGQSRLANNVQLEGIDDNHRTGLLTTLIPSAEALDAVNITTSNYDAEFGRAGGAITNVTLRSGTNKYKGSVFAFGNNEKTSAPGYFSHLNPATQYLQAGFTLGGPIVRDRLFFFGDYQHTSDKNGRTTRATLPTMPFRNGDFSAAPTIIYDPATGDASGNNRKPFPNNVIPQDRISPIAKAILSHVPEPNLAAALGQTNFQVPYTRTKTTDSFDAKINYQVSDKGQLSGRLSFMRPDIYDPPVFGIYGGGGKDFSGTGTDTTWSTGLNYTRMWTPTLLMEARGGVNYYHNIAVTAANGLRTSDEIGIRGANLDDYTSGITSMDISGISSPMVGFANSLPWDRSERTIQFATVFTKVKGNHTIKFGEDFRHTRDFLLQTQDNGGPRGRYQFRSAQTASPKDSAAQNGFANAFASFLLDVPSGIGRDLKVLNPGVRQWAFFTFVQDKWAVTPRVTVDLGMRHEFYTPFVGLEDKGGLSNYDPETNTLRVAGYGDIPQNAGVKAYYKNFAPRGGVSFRLTEADVIRGGYGVSTIPFPDNSYIYNYPVKQNNQFNAPNSFASAGSMKTGFPDPIFVAIPSDGIIDASTPALKTQAYFNVPTDVHEGALHSWNVAYQRRLTSNWSVEVAYVGNRGRDILASVNLNAGLVLGADNAGRPYYQKWGRTADITSWVPTKATYHSLQAKVDRKFANGILMTTSYTLGRAMSYAGGDSNGGPSTPADWERSWARTDQDRLHNLVVSFLYQLPFGAGKRWLTDGAASQILGGWQVSGFFSAMSGLPINFTASGATLKAPGNTQRPDATGTPKVLGGIGPGDPWFDTSVFSAPAAGVWGSVGRNNLLDGPGFVNLDATLSKRIQLPRGMAADFRVDVFNVTNTPHFNNPSGSFGSANFGQVTSAYGQREMRFGLKVTF